MRKFLVEKAERNQECDGTPKYQGKGVLVNWKLKTKTQRIKTWIMPRIYAGRTDTVETLILVSNTGFSFGPWILDLFGKPSFFYFAETLSFGKF